ncbi:MAG: glycosyltransferase [Pseudomonadota bacterium]
MARAIVNHAPDILYSDESTLTVDGRFLHVHFKPDYTREMILSQNYICHFGVYRREIALEAGGFRPNFEGSQDHDFLLRCLQQATSIFHVTRMLYYWRAVPGSTAARFENKNHAWAAGRRAVASAASAVSSACEVEFGKNPGTYRVIHPRPALPSVTIIIPFRDEPEMLNACLASLEETLPAEGLRILGVDNQSAEKETTNLMQEWSCKSSRVQFLTYDHPFNYAAINNFAARHANTKHLLLLNNDVTAIESGWLEEMVSLSELRDVGAVGAKLLYPDDTLQHAGVIMGIGGVAGHSHKGLPDNMPGYFCRPSIHQNVSAVTGACLMVKADLFRRIGGLKERDLGVAFNDVDFCLRLIEAAYSNVYTPHATLYHNESKSRGYEDTPEKRQRFYAERSYMLRRHSIALSLGDPWYNPNLTLRTEDFARREDTRP